MIRCPSICSVVVWTNSARNAPTSVPRYSSATRADAGQVAGGDVAVDGALDEHRLRQLERHAGDDGDQGEQGARPCTGAGSRSAGA